MASTHGLCATVIVLAVGVFAGLTRPSAAAPQAPAIADAAAYAGLLGTREGHDKLTQNPRDVTISVTHTRRPRKFDDPLLTAAPYVRIVTSATCEADLIVAALATSEEPFLNPAETWILTRHRLQISEVIKARDARLGTLDELTYVHPSGGTTLRGRPVSTVVSSYPRLKQGQEYLFFLKRIPQTGHYRSVLDIPVLAGGDTWRAYVEADADTPKQLRDGLPEGDALAFIAAANCRVGK